MTPSIWRCLQKLIFIFWWSKDFFAHWGGGKANRDQILLCFFSFILYEMNGSKVVYFLLCLQHFVSAYWELMFTLVCYCIWLSGKSSWNLFTDHLKALDCVDFVGASHQVVRNVAFLTKIPQKAEHYCIEMKEEGIFMWAFAEFFLLQTSKDLKKKKKTSWNQAPLDLIVMGRRQCAYPHRSGVRIQCSFRVLVPAVHHWT